MRVVTIDLFSGMGGFALASHSLGWETMVLCEIDPAGQAILRHHFPGAYLHGDIKTLTGDLINEEIERRLGIGWRESTRVLVCGGFPCFVQGTLILTSEGLKPIETVNIGDMVLAHDGEYGEVNAVMQKDNAPIYRLRAQGIPKPIETTHEHPFCVRRKIFPCARKYEDRWGPPEWIPASKVRIGDKVGYRVREGSLEYKDADFWFLVGRYLADGHISNGYVRIDANASKSIPLIELIQRLGLHHIDREGRTCRRISIRDGALMEFLESFGKYAHGKKLPGICFELSANLKRALFNGWAAGDGYEVGSGGHRVTTTSKELAFGMAQIARDGFKTPVSMGYCTPSRTDCIIEGRKVNERPFYRVTQPNSNRYGNFVDGFIWCNVTLSEETDYLKTVYNIGVHGQETYTADGITVHNCQPYSSAGKRLGKEDDRHLWPEMLRVIQECRPDAVVGENVSGIVSWDGGLVFEEVQTDLEAQGFEVQAVVVPACAVGAPHRRDRVWFVANSRSKRAGGIR